MVEKKIKSKTKKKDDIKEIKIVKVSKSLDFATTLGLLFGVGLIVAAVLIGNSNANFINMPAILMVIFGTFAVTSVSFSISEMRNAGKVVWGSFLYKDYSPTIMAKQIINIAVISRKKGPLALSQAEKELKKDEYLYNSVRMITDGYTAEDIERIMENETAALAERHSRSADILRRGAEIAPAMGLIGTLVGLVQMLAELDDPNKIGPAMAMALLTTFYGAILGTIILGPMAAKLEKNSGDELLIRNIVTAGIESISKQENPRKLEAVLNSILPPKEQIKYFD